MIAVDSSVMIPSITSAFTTDASMRWIDLAPETPAPAPAEWSITICAPLGFRELNTARVSAAAASAPRQPWMSWQFCAVK